MRKHVVAWVLLAVVSAVVAPVAAGVLPAKYRLEPFATSLDKAEASALAPDGRIFVLERVTGNVRVIRDGMLLAAPFVTVPVATNAGTSESGLLGIAVHPDFLTNGWVYLYYTHDLGGGSSTNRIVRYTAAGEVGVDPVVLLDNIGAGPTGNDNGGALTFGPDGMLYAAVGVMEDDASASSMSSLGGKILRMDPGDGSAPPDNPNTGLSSPYDLIWALGLRNAAGMAFNEDVGTLYVTDSYATEGAVDCDEVNVAMENMDYGWNALACGTPGYPPAPMEAITPKITAWGVTPYTADKYAGSCSDAPAKSCDTDADCKQCTGVDMACEQDSDCSWCIEDPGLSCTTDLDCSFCMNLDNVPCSSDAECKTCDIQPFVRPCDTDTDCTRCSRAPYEWCTSDDDCSAGGSKCTDTNACVQLWSCDLDTCGGTCGDSCDDPANNLFVAGANSGSTGIMRDVLTGVDYDESAVSSDFYVPSGACPTEVTSLAQGSDGWIYATAAGTGAGLYRLIYDDYGLTEAAPREVGATEYAPLTLGKQGSGLEFRWEDLKRDAWGCSTRSYCTGTEVLEFCDDDGDCTGSCVSRDCPTGSKTTKYTLWSGTLTSPFTYGHTVLAEVDGTDAGDALVSHVEGSVPAGDTYYLVSARGANLEGTTGYDSASVERPGYATTNRCDDIGYGDQYSDYEVCVGDGPGEYADQNNRMRSLDDFRGKTVLLSLMQYG